ncbi:MAG: hypothetical protein EOO45_02175 [Flavobacterium sp.]|nr:MAG: hypothetical protein EOO45_02175 [Flavobacterium sp.]
MHFKLTEEIIALSVSKFWEQAKLEWNFDYLYVAEEVQTCLCGHYPIRNICVITNHKNDERTQVGNCCVNKFLGIENGNKILDAIKRLKADPEKSMGADVLEYLMQKQVISDWDYEFYTDTIRKRVLSTKQLEHRERINQKLIDFTSGETATMMSKIDRILKWSEDQEDFDTGFVDSVKRSCQRNGKLTTNQEKALDKIILGFKIK